MRTAKVIGLVLVVIGLSGCAAGSATAGYSVSAGTADDLKGEARTRIIDDAVARAKAYTDQRIAELEARR